LCSRSPHARSSRPSFEVSRMQCQQDVHLATDMTEVADAQFVKAFNDAESEASTHMDDDGWNSERPGDDIVDETQSEPGFARGATLIIFDWDDTLLPTTWLDELGLLLSSSRSPTPEQWTRLQDMATSAAASLTYALTFGKVVIVTNAEEGWVEASCHKFMPSLEPLLSEIGVVSARSTCKGQSTHEWKRRAFTQEVSKYFGQDHAGRQNIVSIGDSMYEVKALLEVGVGAEHRLGKSVKLMSYPHVEQMLAQHEVMRDSFRDVVESDEFLDLEIGAEVYGDDDDDTEG